MLETHIDQTLSAIEVHIGQLQHLLTTSNQHLVRLFYTQCWLAGGIILLLLISIVLSIQGLRLQRKIKAGLEQMRDLQEKRVQLAFDRIDILEKVLGLRQVVPEDAPPPPPQVLM